ncbi:mitochondrial enolase superfamily member 1 [Grus japonensis]|uniref:Mitochondrial enolase superfamily member 1 n=1 Tax=Grus japonensis TaxID=30415 RepID=A0ABC9WN61_GRUJA
MRWGTGIEKAEVLNAFLVSVFTSKTGLQKSQVPDLPRGKGWCKADAPLVEEDQGSILGPITFNIFINNLNDGTECTLSKFVDDTKLGGVAGTPEGRPVIQRVLDRLEKLANRNLMKFNKEKCKALHLGRNDPMHQYTLEADQLESSLTENDLHFLVDTRLNMSQRSAFTEKSNGILH